MAMRGRVVDCVTAVRDRQMLSEGSRSHGGWGRHFRDPRATLSGTADALRVISYEPASDRPGQRPGLRAMNAGAVAAFVARHLEFQLSPEYAVDCSTHQISAALRADDHLVSWGHSEGRTAAYRKLIHRARERLLGDLARDGGGWARFQGGPGASLVATYHGIWGTFMIDGGEDADEILDEYQRAARRLRIAGYDFLKAQALGDGAGCCWAQGSASDPSVAATSIAVTSLSFGDEADRQVAMRGAHWLVDALDRGRGRDPTDATHWEEMADSPGDVRFPATPMAVLACVRAGLLNPMPDPVKAAVATIHEMWNERTASWGGGAANSGFVGTSRTVLELNVRLGQGAWDDILQTLARPPANNRRVRVRRPQAPSLHPARLSGSYLVFDEPGVGVPLSNASVELLAALYANNGTTEERPRTPIASLCDLWELSGDAVRKRVGRVQRDVREGRPAFDWTSLGYPVHVEGDDVVRWWEVTVAP